MAALTAVSLRRLLWLLPIARVGGLAWVDRLARVGGLASIDGLARGLPGFVASCGRSVVPVRGSRPVAVGPVPAVAGFPAAATIPFVSVLLVGHDVLGRFSVVADVPPTPPVRRTVGRRYGNSNGQGNKSPCRDVF